MTDLSLTPDDGPVSAECLDSALSKLMSINEFLPEEKATLAGRLLGVSQAPHTSTDTDPAIEIGNIGMGLGKLYAEDSNLMCVPSERLELARRLFDEVPEKQTKWVEPPPAKAEVPKI